MGRSRDPAEPALRLLLAEDEEVTREVLAAELGQAGFAVATAENGLVALDRAREFRPHLVVTDIMMPEMGGVQFCRTLRRDPEFAALPFIFITAYTEVLPALESPASGSGPADEYFGKPVDVPTLAARVRAMVAAAEAAAPRRVLIADDDAVTRTILEHQLAELGYSAAGVESEGLTSEAVGQESPVAILIDSLPAASEDRVRRLRRAAGERTVIIALTGGAADECEACRRAGVDHCVEKPVDMGRLAALLESSLAGEREAVPESLLDPEVVAGMRRLGRKHGIDLLARLATLFIDKTPRRLEDLRRAVTAADGPTIEAEAHFLKGTAGSLGASELSVVCACQEKQAREGDLAAAAASQAAVEDAYRRLMAELEAIVAGGDTPDGAGPTPDPDPAGSGGP